MTPLLDDLVRRTTQRLGGGGGAVTLLGDRAPVVHREPLPPVDDVLARLAREPRTLLMEGDGPGRSDVLGTRLWWDDELLEVCAFGGGGSFSASDVAAVEGFAAQAAVAVMAARLLTEAPVAATADAGHRPRLTGTGERRAPVAPDHAWTFRRRSCCLYYRVPGGSTCADCVLADLRGEPAAGETAD